MRGAPADMGGWSLVRLFYEGGRLLRKHFGDFLPVMLVFIFPVCLTKVYYTQFYLVDFVRPRVLLLFRAPWFDLFAKLFWIICAWKTNWSQVPVAKADNVGCKLRRVPRIRSQHHFGFYVFSNFCLT
jgi:hypothetical protein